MRNFSRYGNATLVLAGALLMSGTVYAQDWHDHGGHPDWHSHGQPQGQQGGGGNSGGQQSVPGGQGRVWQHGPQQNGPQQNGPGNFQHGNSSRGHQFQGSDVNHFNAGDRSLWTSGRWHHGHHGGHDGWWWFTGGDWFFYTQPIYPYPAYVSPDVVYDYNDEGYGDQGPGATWYYCNDPKGYYPYVRSCNGRWEPVPATPPDLQQDQSGPGDEGPPPDDNDGDHAGPQDNGPGDNGPPPDDRGPQQDNGPDQNGPPADGPPANTQGH